MRTGLPAWLSMSGAGGVQALGNAAAAFLATLVLGPEQRGLMVVVITVGSVVGLVAGLGSGPALRVLLPLADERMSQGLRASFLWVTLGAVASGAALTPLLSLLSAPLIGPQLDQAEMLLAAAVFGGGQVLATQANDAWFASGHFKRGSAGAAATSAVGFLALAGTLGVMGEGLPASAALGAQALGTCAVGAVQLMDLIRREALSVGPASRVAARLLLARGLPALGLTVGLALALRADRYALGVFAGPAAVGVYSLAATLAEIPRLVPSALGQLYLRDVAQGRGWERARPTFRFALGWAVVAGAVVGAVGWFAIPLFGAEFMAARSQLLVLCGAEIGFAAFFVASRGLVGAGRTVTAGKLGLVGAALAVLVYSAGSYLAAGVGVAAASAVLYVLLAGVTSRELMRSLDGERTSTAPRGR